MLLFSASEERALQDTQLILPTGQISANKWNPWTFYLDLVYTYTANECYADNKKELQG